MEAGQFKIAVKIEGVRVDGVPVLREFEVGVTHEQAAELLAGIANLVDAFCVKK